MPEDPAPATIDDVKAELAASKTQYRDLSAKYTTLRREGQDTAQLQSELQAIRIQVGALAQVAAIGDPSTPEAQEILTKAATDIEATTRQSAVASYWRGELERNLEDVGLDWDDPRLAGAHELYDGGKPQEAIRMVRTTAVTKTEPVKAPTAPPAPTVEEQIKAAVDAALQASGVRRADTKDSSVPVPLAKVTRKDFDDNITTARSARELAQTHKGLLDRFYGKR